MDWNDKDDVLEVLGTFFSTESGTGIGEVLEHIFLGDYPFKARIATAMAQGLLAGGSKADPTDLATKAVDYADALEDELGRRLAEKDRLEREAREKRRLFG